MTDPFSEIQRAIMSCLQRHELIESSGYILDRQDSPRESKAARKGKAIINVTPSTITQIDRRGSCAFEILREWQIEIATASRDEFESLLPLEWAVVESILCHRQTLKQLHGEGWRLSDVQVGTSQPIAGVVVTGASDQWSTVATILTAISINAPKGIASKCDVPATT